MVEQAALPGQTFFRIKFCDNIPPLTLLRANDFKQEKFWTSVPEGRQKLAEEIGPLIEQYYRTQKK